jgi:hypothetical protein
LAAASTGVPGKLLAQASELLTGLQATKINKYFDGCGDFQKIRWGKHCAEAYVDSSSLMTLLLFKGASWNADMLEANVGCVNPTAAGYYDSIKTGKGAWIQVACILKVEPGDIITVLHPDAKEGEVSGHVMLVTKKPREMKNQKLKPLIQDGVEFEVVVIDAATTPHGKTDTRATNPGKFGPSGVGQGSIRLYSNKEGEILGHAWSMEEKSPMYTICERPIMIGRLP